MSIKSLNGGVFGFEDADVEGTEEAIVVDADTNDAVADVVEDGGAIDEATKDIEETAADTETLEKIEEVIAQAESSGEGLSEDAAAMANVAVEAIRIRMGGKGGLRALGAENFGQKADRLSSTRLALEGIGDTIKNAWAAVLKFVEKVWNAIKDFFTRIFDAAERLKASAKKMKKYLDDKLSDRDRDDKVKEFEDASLANKLAMSSQAIDAAQIIDTIKIVDGLVGSVNASTQVYTTSLDELVKMSDAFITKGEAHFQNGDSVKFTNEVTKITDLIKAQAKNIKLPGGSSIDATVTPDGKKIKIKLVESKQTVNSKIKIGTEAELKTICDDVFKMAEAMTKMRSADKAIAQSSKIIGELLKKVNGVSKIRDNGQSVNVTYNQAGVVAYKETMKTARSAITNSSSCMQSLLQKFPTEAVKLGHASLKYISKCVSVGYAHKFDSED